MELIISGYFEVAESDAPTVAGAFEEVTAETAREQGCLAVTASRRDDAPGVFHVYSRWASDADFEHHMTLPHTLAFFDIVRPLVTRPSDLVKLRPL